ncbi:MAG: molybdenum cofactor guanylyltransferase [Planctomycetota bacterium]
MEAAAIVLCGGSSRRMGRTKALLPWGRGTLLEHVVDRVGEVVDEVVVVAREDQEITFSRSIPMVRDAAEGLGPLAGLAAGLAAIEAERAFLVSCDMPFLRPAFVRRLLDLSAGHDAAVAEIDGYFMVTAAVYSKAALPVARELVAARRLRPRFLLDGLDTRVVAADELLDVDPELESFRNCNTPEEYAAALRDAGIGS